MFLDIHLEKCDDKGERLRSILESGKPFGISVVPVLLMPEHEAFKTGVYPADYFYPREIVDILKKCSENPNVVFGQQGFLHYCPECFQAKEKHDPWHENRCLYGRRKSADEQAAFMRKGKRVIEDVLGVSPIIYSTPNHQFDGNTLEAARKLGYSYFTERAVINLSPHAERGLIILPERKPHQSGEVFYTHYDQIADSPGRHSDIINGSQPLYRLQIENNPAGVFLNSGLSTARKWFRDLKKQAGI